MKIQKNFSVVLDFENKIFSKTLFDYIEKEKQASWSGDFSKELLKEKFMFSFSTGEREPRGIFFKLKRWQRINNWTFKNKVLIVFEKIEEEE